MLNMAIVLVAVDITVVYQVRLVHAEESVQLVRRAQPVQQVRRAKPVKLVRKAKRAQLVRSGLEETPSILLQTNQLLMNNI